MRNSNFPGLDELILWIIVLAVIFIRISTIYCSQHTSICYLQNFEIPPQWWSNQKQTTISCILSTPSIYLIYTLLLFQSNELLHYARMIRHTQYWLSWNRYLFTSKRFKSFSHVLVGNISCLVHTVLILLMDVPSANLAIIVLCNTVGAKWLWTIRFL